MHFMVHLKMLTVTSTYVLPDRNNNQEGRTHSELARLFAQLECILWLRVAVHSLHIPTTQAVLCSPNPISSICEGIACKRGRSCNWVSLSLTGLWTMVPTPAWEGEGEGEPGLLLLGGQH